MRLNNGFEIPQIGVGTWTLRGETARQNVRLALRQGKVRSPMLSTSGFLPSPTAACAAVHASRLCSFASYNYIIRIASLTSS